MAGQVGEGLVDPMLSQGVASGRTNFWLGDKVLKKGTWGVKCLAMCAIFAVIIIFVPCNKKIITIRTQHIVALLGRTRLFCCHTLLGTRCAKVRSPTGTSHTVVSP